VPRREKEVDVQRVRKDSIGMPRPLGSPFDVEGGARERRGGEVGYGEAT
jgi:hypothetical protein